MLGGRYLPRREASWEFARSTRSMLRRAETRSTLDSGLASTLSSSERCGSFSGGSERGPRASVGFDGVWRAAGGRVGWSGLT